nr:translation initiation factor IF-5A [Candidatus Woesearchaeota archaeon]
MSLKQQEASSLKIGSFVVFDGFACKVVKIDMSKTGKHGHTKCRIEASGLIDNRKIIKLMPGSDRVDIPLIEKKNAQVLSIHGDIANVMDVSTYETFDLKIPEELKAEVKEGKEVLYWIILNDKIIKQVK